MARATGIKLIQTDCESLRASRAVYGLLRQGRVVLVSFPKITRAKKAKKKAKRKA